MKTLMHIFFLFIFLGTALAQYRIHENEIQLTGNINLDSKILSAELIESSNSSISFSTPKRKSPMLAGLFSLIVPGAGQFYNEEFWKSAIFLAVEAAVITTAIIYDNKGDEQTAVFENFADNNWSVVRYAEWLIQFKGGDPAMIISNDPNLPPWKRVDWNLLNQSEKDFSHKLPPYGDQQYYELIGKYPQYSRGWVGASWDDDYNTIPQIFSDYSKMRGEANDLYAVASTAVIGLYINHFLSMIEAIWSAALHNSNIEVSMRMNSTGMQVNKIDLYPTVNLKYSF